jgi:hypothetical protein
LKKLPVHNSSLSPAPAAAPHYVETHVVILALFFLGFLLARFAAPIFNLLPPCTFHTVFGLPCPSCGATSAGLALARGEWRTALAHNPLFVIGIGVLTLWSVMGLLERWRGKTVRQNYFRKILVKIGAPSNPAEFRRQIRWLALGAITLNWLYLIWAE